MSGFGTAHNPVIGSPGLAVIAPTFNEVDHIARLVCGIGTLANVGMAAYLFPWNSDWVPAALAGIAVSSVWLYVLTSVFTWTQPGRR
jgi:hypothetical protein